MLALRKQRSTKEAEMVKILQEKLSDDVNFINGVMNFLEDDGERQDMIDEIMNGNVETPSDDLLFALEIEEDRENN